MLMLAADFITEDSIFWVVGGGIAIFAIAAGTISSILKTRAQERSRREIAAYIAEGAMTAEQGEKLMRAAPDENALS